MGVLWIAVAALSANPPPALFHAASENLASELDGAAIQDLATGELILLHHPAALARAYPPGSTLKLIAAYAALQSGGDVPLFRHRCTGKEEVLGRNRHCWVPHGHGELDLDAALAQSCNLYFYELGARLKPAAWLDAAQAFGLGQPTGAPIENESPGELPSELPLEVLSDAAAGEGAHLRVTPMQMLGVIGAIATGGERLRPVAAGQGRQVAGRVGGAASLRRIADDLHRAVLVGTLAGSGLDALGVAGKTGTARWARGYHTHGWFVGFAPREAPRYAMVVFVDEGGGAADAGKAALALFDALLPAPARREREVRVRVLERERPRRLSAHLDLGATATCDGEPLSGSDFVLRLDAPQVVVESVADQGQRRCQRVELAGGAKLSAGKVAPKAVEESPLPPAGEGQGEGSAVEHALRGGGPEYPHPNPLPRAGEGAGGARPSQGSHAYLGTLRIQPHGPELEVVDTLDLEQYVAAVVDAESESREPAALEAQAIVSRTFAAREARRHGADYDFCELTHCQSFRGLPIAPDALRGTAATAGQVLADDGRLLHAYFHSTCGGHTASAAEVLGDTPERALAGVSDLDEHGKPWCAASPHLRWSYEVGRAELAQAVGGTDPSEGVRVLQADHEGTVLRIRAFGVTLGGEAFKSRVNRRFGWQSIQSTRFDVEERDGQFVFHGAGLGHRVGLCQFGAAAQAAAGWSADRILTHYFPGATIVTLDALGDRMPP